MKKLLSLILLLSFTIKAQEIKIGTQTWTSKNLDVTTYRNGETIPQVQDRKALLSLKTGAWCYYDFKIANGIKYGKLYNWYAVNDPRGLAPKGYHIPTKEEWTMLTDYLGSKAGKKMKSTSGWDSFTSGTGSKTCPNCADWNSEYHRKVACNTCRDSRSVSAPKKTHSGNGDNASAFNGLPGGFWDYLNGWREDASLEDIFLPPFEGIGVCGSWWSSSVTDGKGLSGEREGYSIDLTNEDVNNLDSHSIFDFSFLNSCSMNTNSKSTFCSVRLLRGQSNNSFQGDQSNSPFEVTIGNQIWTSKNLNVSTYRNGDAIPQVQDPESWGKLSTGAWCYYENETEFGPKYGKLYNWYAVNDRRGLAPEGYHIPTDAESKTLIYYLGEKSSTKMKNIRGGYRASDGNYNYLGEEGYWWSSSLENGGQARCRILNKNDDKPWSYYYPMRYGFSVLCLSDGISGEDDKKNVNKPFVPVRDGKTETKPVTTPTPTVIQKPTYTSTEDKDF